METLFLSVTLAMPAVAVGLHWRHLTRTRCAAPQAATASRAGHHETARAEPVAKLDESDCAAWASVERKFAAIMARLDRIEAHIDLLPDKAA